MSPVLSDDNDEEDVNKNTPKRIYIFGKDIRCIPCVRDAALYGCIASTVSTLITFLFTSNGFKALKVGIWGFGLGTYPYWYYCQYHYFKDLRELKETEDRLKMRTKAEYTLFDDIEHITADTYG